MTDYINSTGVIDESMVLSTGPVEIESVQVISNGTNDATLQIYDAPSQTTLSDAVFWEKVSGTQRAKFHEFRRPMKFSSGCYIRLVGTGASAIVNYRNN